ncbi:MAG: SDR family oxidoreductase [Xanthomonadales bacterium]|nr:SDR family oxidoreductase [Xanthomonadales bacterium]
MQKSKPTVLITGACGGIGKALVRAFSADNYFIVATDRVRPPDNGLIDEFIQAELEKTVTDEVYAAEIFSKIQDKIQGDGLNALINNAAWQKIKAFQKLTRDDWSNTLKVNLLAPVFWSQAFMSELTKASGAIVNLSSIHATQTKPGFSAYATSKAALSALTRNMAVEISGVRINAIEPAAVSTEMLEAGFNVYEGARRELDSLHPLGRIATPDEIAKVAVFLCSKASTFIHGSCISVSGGIQSCLLDPGNK